VKTLKDSGAIERNFERWTGIEVDYDAEISALKDYLNPKNQLDGSENYTNVNT
jgi:bacillopeptidase F (M6 metalloprotease family)